MPVTHWVVIHCCMAPQLQPQAGVLHPLLFGEITMKVELRKMSAIKPNESNPRHNDDAVNAVAASIKECGFQQPLVIDDNNVTITGHTRYKAALKLGLDEVPVSLPGIFLWRRSRRIISRITRWPICPKHSQPKRAASRCPMCRPSSICSTCLPPHRFQPLCISQDRGHFSHS